MASEYAVERIDNMKVIDGATFYYIKWKGWADTYNTWEPLENLNGCPQVLKEFEKRQTKKGTRRVGRGKSTNDQDDKEDVDDILAETAEHMKHYGILPKWPADKEPLSVEGVIIVEGKLTYVVRRKSSQRSTGLTRANANLVYAKNFRLQYPDLVIKFYEKRLLWSDNAKKEEEQANVASQGALLHQNLGSRRGKMIANDMDCKLREMYDKRKATNNQIEPEAKGSASSSSEDQGIEDDDALEEEEVQDDENSRGDNFGLPSSLEDASSDGETSGSESELEEMDIESKQEEWNWKRAAKTLNQGMSDEEEGWNWKRMTKTANQSVNENDDGVLSDY